MTTAATKTEWKETTLGEVAIVDWGNTNLTKRVYEPNGEYLAVSAAGCDGRISHAEHPVGTTVISAIGEYAGTVYYPREPFTAIKNTITVKAKDGLADDNYLFYLLLKNRIPRRGAAQPFLSKGDTNAYQVIIPPLNEQRSIAAVLSSLDNKIELLRKQNETLEQIAQAIFNEWFVKSTTGDELPEGWKTTKIADVAYVTIGRTPPRKEKEWFSLNPDDKIWISIKDLGVNGTYIDSTSEYLTPEAVERFKIPLIPKGTVVVSFKLTVGRVAIAAEDMYSNEAIAHIKVHALPTEYTYLYFKSFDYNSLGSTSSIATATNSEAIRQMEITVPDKDTLARFTNAVGPLFKRILLNTHSDITLVTLRDSLLPRLMSGEIKV